MPDKKIEKMSIAESGLGGLRPGAIQLTLRNAPSAKSIHAALDKIFRLHGCPTCGLNGLDIRLRPQEVLFNEFQDLPEVMDIQRIR